MSPEPTTTGPPDLSDYVRSNLAWHGVQLPSLWAQP